MEDLEAPNGRRDALSSPTERRVQLQQRYSTPVVSDRDAVTQESSVKTRRSALSIPRLTKRLLGWASESRVHIIDAEYPVVPGAVQREISVQSENIRRSSKPRVVYRVDPVKRKSRMKRNCERMLAVFYFLLEKCRLTQDFVHVMLQGQQASYASPSEFMKDLHSYLVDYELIENSEEQEELNSPRSATSAKSLDETVRVREISGFSSASLNGNAHEQNDDVHKRMTLKKRPSLMGASMNRTKVVRTLTKLEKISSMDQKMQKEIKNLISNFNTAAPHNLGINPNSYTADPSNPIQKGVPGLTSLMTMINHLCIEKCGEDLQQEYHEKYMYTQIKPHTDDVDMALLEELKSSRITFESIRYAFSDSKHLDFLRKKQSEFQEICADLLSEFKDNSGEIIFSKFKTHFSYWRSLCSRACINLPFLNLFDNLLFVLFYYDEFPEKHYLFQTEDSNDENPSERRPSSRSDEIRPSIQTIFNPDLSLESMDQGLNTISRIANHYAKVHFRQKRMLFGNKLDTSSAQTNVNSKFSRAKDKVTDLSSQILTAILFILTVIVGVLVMFFSWKLQLENLSSTSYHRIADSTLYSSKATLHNHFDFASSWMGMVKHKTDESIFYSGGFSTDLEFQHRLVYISWTHNAKSCYIGSSSGVFIGVMSNADDSSSNYFTVFLRNESSGPLYSFPASIDPVLGTVSFGVSSLFSSNFSFEHLPWFITGIQLQPRMSEWTRKYSASAPFPNEELISLSSNVWNPNNSSVFAVLGFDITISSIQYELSRNLFYGEDAAHLQIHQFFVLAWDISSSLLVDYYPPMFDSRESLGELIYGLTTNTTILDEFPNLDQSNSTILRYFSIEKSNTHDAYDISLAIFSLPNGLDLAIAALVSRSAFDERLNLAFLITVILMGFTIISAILVSAVALRELRSSVEKPSAIDWQKKAFSLFVKPELELRVKKENLKGKVIEEELSLRSGSFSDDQNAKARSRQQSMLNKKSIEDERSMDNVDRDFDPQYEYPRRADSEPDEEEIEDVQSEHIPAASCLSTYLELIKEYVFALYTYSCLLFSSMMDLCREFILRFGFILVFMGLIAIWFVWVQYSINIVLNISDAYLSNTVKGLAGSLENLIDVPQIAARIIHLDYIDGKIPFSDSLLDTAERDAYFQNFFRNLMTSSHFGSSIHAIYIGLSDGTLSGATSQVNSNDTFFHVMAKDNTTGQCFTIYPAVDNVLARDLSSPIFQSPECLYDHRQTEWYRDLALSKKASWSRRYLLHTTDPSVQINGITFSIPIIDENNEFFGAIAIDADLDSVSSIIRRSELISAYNSSTTRVFLTLRKNLEHTKDSCSRGCIKSSSEFLAVSSGFPPDILVEDTNTVLQRNEVIGSINATKIIRAFDDPFTFVSSVRGNSAIFGDLILLVGMNDVQKELENMQIFVFLVLMGTCAVIDLHFLILQHLLFMFFIFRYLYTSCQLD